jgi:hypothetical protein
MTRFPFHPTHLVATLVLLASATAPQPLGAQIGGLRRAAQRAAGALPDPTALLRGDPPITTNLRDAIWGVDTMDAFEPAEFTDLTTLERTPNGGFILRAGAFEMHTQSYCLHAGTHGPNPEDRGDGYLYAPTRGPADDPVRSVVRNSVRHPDIPQRKVQVLLWAIIARAKFEDLQPDLKETAIQLLTPQQILTLNRGALEIAQPVLERAIANAPPLVRQALEAEAALRHTLTSGAGTFEDVERLAVLTGLAPRGAGSRDVPRGRWSLHPDGYYVRYLPHGYSYTVTQFWVPKESPAIGREYDPATHIATPGNTSRQRLIQSGRVRQH